MSRTLKIEGLSDAQCDALAEEAKAAGRKFYDHCRDKLLANMAVAASAAWVRSEVPANLRRFVPEATEMTRLVAPAAEPVDRIGRLEGAVMRLTNLVEHIAVGGGQPVAGEQPGADNPEIDVDDVIGQSLQEAEQQGLMVVEREQPAQAGGVRHIGQRRPAPYSVHSVPQHLRNL